MNSLFTKIKRTLNYHYFRLRNGWHFPPNTAHIAGARMAKGTHEPEVTKVVKNQLKEGSLFLDVGANIGYFSRMASGIVKEAGAIYAFEVEYDNFYSLCKNTLSLNNVTPINFAVCDRQDFLKIFRSSHSSCHSIMETDNYLSGEVFSAPAITLDLFWEQYLNKSKIDLIKIDVEGAEILVLRGLKGIISEDKIRTIILECCPQIMINSNRKPEDIYDFLAPYFTVSVIEEKFKNGEEIGNKMEFNDIIDRILELDGAENMNLLCKRK